MPGRVAKWLLVTAAIAALCGCGGMRSGTGLKETPGDRPHWTVTDDLGRQVIVPINLKRVVSLAPSVTENVFAVGGGDRLVGVTTFCNFPDEARSIAKIGDTMSPNMEVIVALRPELVLVTTASQIEAFTKVLEENGIVVYVTNPTSLDDVFRDLERLGQLFGTEEKAKQVVASLAARVESVRSASRDTTPSRVFIQISNEPLFTIGKGSYLNGLLEIANAISVTANVETAFPRLSKESALTLNPDVIILSDSEDNKEVNDAYRTSPAVRTGRVYRIDPDILSRPGPRLVDALEEIARVLRPDRPRSR